MKRALLRVIVVAIVLSAGAPNAYSESPPSPLESLRAQLTEATRYDPLHLHLESGDLELAGYLEHRVLSLGEGRLLVVISQMRGAPGQLLLFSESGAFLDRLEAAHEFASYTLCDLDQDGVSEVIVDQLEGWGTGIYLRRFVLVRATDALEELWRGVSVSAHEITGTDVTETEFGWLRCDPSGWGHSQPRLMHAVKRSVDATSRVDSYELQKDGLVKLEDERTASPRP